MGDTAFFIVEKSNNGHKKPFLLIQNKIKRNYPAKAAMKKKVKFKKKVLYLRLDIRIKTGTNGILLSLLTPMNRKEPSELSKLKTIIFSTILTFQFMKKVFQLTFSLVILFLTSTSVEAVTMSKNQALNSEKLSTITPKQDEANSSNKKMNFVERLAFKVIQKKIQKTLAFKKSKSNNDGSESDGQLSLLSCIFGVLGLLLLLTSSSTLVLLGLLVGISGFVMGLIGLKKENSKAMAIIGLVAGSLVLLIFLAAIILVASYI